MSPRLHNSPLPEPLYHRCGHRLRQVQIPRLVFPIRGDRQRPVVDGLEWAIWCDACDIGGMPVVPGVPPTLDSVDHETREALELST